MEIRRLTPGDKGGQINELYEGEINTWYLRNSMLKDKPNLVREAMSDAIKQSQGKFEVDDVVAHPELVKFCRIEKIDLVSKTATLWDGEHKYEKSYNELFNPNIFRNITLLKL